MAQKQHAEISFLNETDHQMPLQVAYIVPSPLQKLEGRVFSSIASIRLRCLLIAPELVTLGYNGVLIYESDLSNAVSDGRLEKCDLIVIYKPQRNFDYFSIFKSVRQPIVLDMCDESTLQHDDLVSLATVVTTSSPGLARLARDGLHRSVCAGLYRG